MTTIGGVASGRLPKSLPGLLDPDPPPPKREPKSDLAEGLVFERFLTVREGDVDRGRGGAVGVAAGSGLPVARRLVTSADDPRLTGLTASRRPDPDEVDELGTGESVCGGVLLGP